MKMEPVIITKATALIENLTWKLKNALPELDGPTSPQYQDQLQQWIATASNTIGLTNNNIVEMDRVPTPTTTNPSYVKAKLAYETAVANFRTIESEVRCKLHVAAINRNDVIIGFPGNIASGAAYDAPPPSYGQVMGEAAAMPPSAPPLQNQMIPVAGQAAPQPQIYPRQQNVIYVAGPPNIRPVPFPIAPKRNRCTGWRISILVVVVIIKIIIIVTIVNRYRASWPPKSSSFSYSQIQDVYRSDGSLDTDRFNNILDSQRFNEQWNGR